ncbi:MAG: ferredoxin [Dehalococcoidia bacterium]|nr:ferredoxin [Dehalococcoidia bacterium]
MGSSLEELTGRTGRTEQAMQKLVIERRLCLKSGQCSYLQPDVFKRDDENWPVVTIEHPEGEQIEQATDAIEMCPAQAISLVEEDGS